MSRLKKKLLLYFILVAIVSISVSAEIILEMSSPRFRTSIQNNFYQELGKQVSPELLARLRANISEEEVFRPLFSFRNRMILLLMVISASIFAAFMLFARDIVSPMDGMVDATKKIADGDLTVTVPVMSEDEIGQMGRLINDMNINLQDMIMQIRQEVERHNKKIRDLNAKIAGIMTPELSDNVELSRRMKLSDFKKLFELGREVDGMLVSMSSDLAALLAFINMYKTYRSKTQAEITQEELDRAITAYQDENWE